MDDQGETGVLKNTECKAGREKRGKVNGLKLNAPRMVNKGVVIST